MAHQRDPQILGTLGAISTPVRRRRGYVPVARPSIGRRSWFSAYKRHARFDRQLAGRKVAILCTTMNYAPTSCSYLMDNTLMLTGAAELEPGDMLGYAFARLLRVPVHSVRDVDNTAERSTEPPDTRSGPSGDGCSSSPIHLRTEDSRARSDPAEPTPQRAPRIPTIRLKCCWNVSTRSNTRGFRHFGLNCRLICDRSRLVYMTPPGWTPQVITSLGDVLCEFKDVFSTSPTDAGSCFLLPFKIANYGQV